MTQLEFGTAGIRAKMGAGSDGLNVYTVRQVSKGLVEYLKDKNPKGGKVCISYDSRLCSRLFARHAAKVFAENGLTAIITKTLMPSPFLSFMTRYYGADAGVMITASHNPKEYNGYKVYGADGGQLTDAAASKLAGCIDRCDYCNKKADEIGFNDLIKQGRIIQTAMKKPYLDAVKSSIKNYMTKETKNAQSALKVMFTPLNGAGHILVRDMLEFTGVNIDVVPEQNYPDGKFETCPAPNPENQAAFDLALKYASKNNSDIIIATDPDADRVGVMVKHSSGYQRLSGNEMGVLLTEFLLRQKANQEAKSAQPLIVRTVVSTPLTDKIALEYGAQIKEVLTGFKYIGEQITALCHPEPAKDSLHGAGSYFLFGFEESCGYLSGTHARDKDGVEASALIALMAAEYKKKGKTLINAIDDIYKKYGYYLHKTLAYRFEDTSNKRVFEIMDILRNGVGIDGLQTTEKKDYMTSQNGLPLTNMTEFALKNGRIIVRPSGTEPLIKVYITLICDPKNAETEFIGLKKLCDLFFS